MSTLAVIAYPDQSTAGEAAAALQRMQKEFLIELEDVAWVTKAQDGKMKLHQATSLTGAGAAGGAFWGFLFGLLFFVPIFGMAVGAATGALAGHFAHYGIDHKWINEVASAIPPGGSALFVMARNTNQERVLPEMAKLGGTVLKTNLSIRAAAGAGRGALPTRCVRRGPGRHRAGACPRARRLPVPHHIGQRRSGHWRTRSNAAMSWSEDLAPRAVWGHFDELTQIPRPSHHEERVSAFLAGFGRNLGLETTVDAVGDVLIRKPASAGMENRPGVILQAHMDMVPEKAPGKIHDFATDPIPALVEAGWVRTDGTTLGADDGIGVAIIMALLEDGEIAHGPLEALFTVNEEDGFTGADALQPGVLQGSLLINVDSEEEGTFTIGSAGGADVDATAATRRSARRRADRSALGDQGAARRPFGHRHRPWPRQRDQTAGSLALERAAGDPHSCGRDRGRAPVQRHPAGCGGGRGRPRRGGDAPDRVRCGVRRNGPAGIGQDRTGSADRRDGAAMPDMVMTPDAQRRIVAALYGCPNGVIRMSDSVPGLVETSTNLGAVSAAKGTFSAGFLVRSAVNSARDDVEGMAASVFALAGIDAVRKDAFTGWRPNPDSPLLALMQAVYRDRWGHDAEVVALHAGLETSEFGATYPGLDMISVGPTIEHPHSPDERLEIASVGKVYELLVATLQRIPAMILHGIRASADRRGSLATLAGAAKSRRDANTPLVAGLYDLLLVKMITLTALVETAGACLMPVEWVPERGRRLSRRLERRQGDVPHPPGCEDRANRHGRRPTRRPLEQANGTDPPREVSSWRPR